MKTIKKQIPILLSLIFLLSLMACEPNKKDKQENKTKLEKKVEQFKGDFKEEQDKLEKDLNQSVEEFNQKLDVYEKELDTMGNQLDEAREEVLFNLKAQRDSIAAEAKMVRNITEENWNDFKDKVEKESNDFQDAVKDFFSEDKK